MNFKSFINTFLLAFLLLITIGCSTTKASKINDSVSVDSIKAGVTTKSDVHRLFGEPSKISYYDYYDGITEKWSYKYNNQKDKVTGGVVKSFLSGAGLSVISSLIPYGGNIGTKALSRGTKRVGNKVVLKGANKVGKSKGTYHLTIGFKGDVVATKHFTGFDSKGMTSLNTKNNSKVKHIGKNKNRTAKKQPVYTTYTSKTFHKKNCSEISNVNTVKFQSSDEIIKAGGTACNICKPY